MWSVATGDGGWLNECHVCGNVSKYRQDPETKAETMVQSTHDDRLKFDKGKAEQIEERKKQQRAKGRP